MRQLSDNFRMLFGSYKFYTLPKVSYIPRVTILKMGKLALEKAWGILQANNSEWILPGVDLDKKHP